MSKTVIGFSGSPQNVVCEVLTNIDGVAVVQLADTGYMAREFFRQAVPGTRVWVAEEAGMQPLIEGRVVIGDPGDLVLQVEG